MTMTTSTTLLQKLSSLINETEIDRLARERGIIQRQRKINLTSLIWTLIIASGGSAQRTIAGLKGHYHQLTGDWIARSSIYDRLSLKLAQLLKDIVVDITKKRMDRSLKPRGHLSRFIRVLALDSSSTHLPDQLASKYPGTRTAAGMKLHCLFDIFGGHIHKVKQSSERVADLAAWRHLGPWLRGSLLLVDLGYYSYQFLSRVDRNGGAFLSRIKSNINPRIVKNNRPVRRGLAIDVVGLKLQYVLYNIKRKVLDVNVEVIVKRNKYNGKQSREKQIFRLIAIYDEEQRGYHGYLTNLPVDELAAEDVTETYGLRWQVEIFFKALRQQHSLDELPSSKKKVIDCLFWASILSSLVSHEGLELAREETPKDRCLPILRWSKYFALAVRDLVICLRAPRSKFSRELAERAWQLLLQLAPDPNLNRKKRAIKPEIVDQYA